MGGLMAAWHTLLDLVRSNVEAVSGVIHSALIAIQRAQVVVTDRQRVSIGRCGWLDTRKLLTNGQSGLVRRFRFVKLATLLQHDPEVRVRCRQHSLNAVIGVRGHRV